MNAADLASVDAMRAARARGLAVLAYNVLEQGLFSGRYRDAASFRGSDLRARGGYFHPTVLPRMLGVLDRLAAVARRLGRTPAQVAVLNIPAVEGGMLGLNVKQGKGLYSLALRPLLPDEQA